MKKTLICIGCVLLMSGILVLMGFTVIKTNNKRKFEAIENPPSQSWIEEDLEFYLFSTRLDVEKYEVEEELLVGIVREIETEKYYMFAYKLIRRDTGLIMVNAYDWKFSHCIEVGKEKIKRVMEEIK